MIAGYTNIYNSPTALSVTPSVCYENIFGLNVGIVSLIKNNTNFNSYKRPIKVAWQPSLRERFFYFNCSEKSKSYLFFHHKEQKTIQDKNHSSKSTCFVLLFKCLQNNFLFFICSENIQKFILISFIHTKKVI